VIRDTRRAGGSPGRLKLSNRRLSTLYMRPGRERRVRLEYSSACGTNTARIERGKVLSDRGHADAQPPILRGLDVRGRPFRGCGAVISGTGIGSTFELGDPKGTATYWKH